jgi:serine/threonine-protein kinase
VAVHDAGTDGEVPFIVMELVVGEPLSEVLSRQGPVSPDRASEIARAVAEALAAAHDRGVIHRDVKPANVLITPTGWVKVLDFGIARVSGGAAADVRAGFGTAEYVSPEQAAGGAADERSDIYALGIMAYEMLTGARPEAPRSRVPFTGFGEMRAMRASLAKAGIAPEIAELLARLLAPRPRLRPSSAADVGYAFARASGQ